MKEVYIMSELNENENPDTKEPETAPAVAEGGDVTPEAADVTSENRDEEKKSEGRPETPTMVLFIRLLCGGYLLYLSFQLFNGEGASKTVVLIAAGVFVIAGAVLIFLSLKALLKKKE